MPKHNIKNILKGAFIVLFFFAWIRYNLLSNSVYYASNIPHLEGEEPELVMMADNYAILPHPDSEYINVTTPLSDASLSSTYFLFPKGYSLAIEIVDEGEGKLYKYDLNTPSDLSPREVIYYYDSHFNLVRAIDTYSGTDIDPDQVNKPYVVDVIKKCVSPFILYQTRPLINLQGLFNIVYWERFN